MYRPNLAIRDKYYADVVPEMRRYISDVTGDTERDDSSIGGSQNKSDMSVANFRALGYRVHGAFIMKATTAPIEITRRNGSVVLGQEETYMGLHLLPLDPHEATREYINQSLRSVAEHLSNPANREGRTLAGITYARLGQTAQRAFGFEVTALPLMPNPAENPDIQPVLVHVPIDTFVEQYTISC